MSTQPEFREAFPYQGDVLALPVVDLDIASRWYSEHFGMREVERREAQHRAVILERNGARIGFAITGEDASQAGAAILVSNLVALRDEFVANGLEIDPPRTDDRDGVEYRVFFVVAPDGLCYYFHEPI